MLTTEEANRVAETLLRSERQSSAGAVGRTRRFWSGSAVVAMFGLVMVDLIVCSWFFVARHWSAGGRALGAMSSVLSCLYIAVVLRRRGH
jgi:hypothetical protein